MSDTEPTTTPSNDGSGPTPTHEDLASIWNCVCGHDLGSEHNGLGCYGRISYTPLVVCTCPRTDDEFETIVEDNVARLVTQHARTAVEAALEPVTALAASMAAASPKPQPGGFIAEALMEAVEAGRVAAVGQSLADAGSTAPRMPESDQYRDVLALMMENLHLGVSGDAIFVEDREIPAPAPLRAALLGLMNDLGPGTSIIGDPS